MKDLRDVLGPLLYFIRVTEFQKCGLPHEHIAVAMKHISKSPAEINKFLSAELPRNYEPPPKRIIGVDGRRNVSMDSQSQPKTSYHSMSVVGHCYLLQSDILNRLSRIL
jgi:hypothetical protein